MAQPGEGADFLGLGRNPSVRQHLKAYADAGVSFSNRGAAVLQDQWHSPGSERLVQVIVMVTAQALWLLSLAGATLLRVAHAEVTAMVRYTGLPLLGVVYDQWGRCGLTLLIQVRDGGAFVAALAQRLPVEAAFEVRDEPGERTRVPEGTERQLRDRLRAGDVPGHLFCGPPLPDWLGGPLEPAPASEDGAGAGGGPGQTSPRSMMSSRGGRMVLHASDGGGEDSVEGGRFDKDPRTGLDIIEMPPEVRGVYPVIERGVVHHFEWVVKVNRKGKQQRRLLVLSDTSVFICDCGKGAYMKPHYRCISIAAIESVHISHARPGGFMALRVPSEYDAVFWSSDHRRIAAVLARISSKALGADLAEHAWEVDQVQPTQLQNGELCCGGETFHLLRPKGWRGHSTSPTHQRVLEAAQRRKEAAQRRADTDARRLEASQRRLAAAQRSMLDVAPGGAPGTEQPAQLHAAAAEAGQQALRSGESEGRNAVRSEELDGAAGLVRALQTLLAATAVQHAPAERPPAGTELDESSLGLLEPSEPALSSIGLPAARPPDELAAAREAAAEALRRVAAGAEAASPPRAAGGPDPFRLLRRAAELFEDSEVPMGELPERLGSPPPPSSGPSPSARPPSEGTPPHGGGSTAAVSVGSSAPPSGTPPPSSQGSDWAGAPLEGGPRRAGSSHTASTPPPSSDPPSADSDLGWGADDSSSSAPSPECHGLLSLASAVHATWRTRNFALHGTELWAAAPAGGGLRHVLSVADARLLETAPPLPRDAPPPPVCAGLRRPPLFAVVTAGGARRLFACPNARQHAAWIAALRGAAAAQESPRRRGLSDQGPSAGRPAGISPA